MGDAVLTQGELAAWFKATSGQTFRAGDGAVTVDQLVRIYYEEGAKEGVAPDVAFVQAILETGWFSFNGSMVKPSDNNFAGMGAYDGSGGSHVFEFPDVRTGVRAQLQHLRIYGDPHVNETGSNLGSPIAQDIENRYPARWRLIRNGTGPLGAYHASATVWERFGGGLWATDVDYARKLVGQVSGSEGIYTRALLYNGYPRDAAQRLAWHLRHTNRGGASDSRAYFGRAGDLVLACDWNGDGSETPGLYRGGQWIISSQRDGGGELTSFTYGRTQDLPLCGDWNGNGRDTIGVVRDGEWHLKNTLSGGNSDIFFTYGRVTRGDVPIVGDWNGNGRDTPGIIRDGDWHLRNVLSGGVGQIVFTYGRITRGDRPLIGDWNGSGRDGPGIVREGEWHLRNTLSGGPAELSFIYGRVTSGDTPLVGDWTGDGRSTPAIVRP